MIDDTLQHLAVRNDVPPAPSRNLSTDRVRLHRERRRRGLTPVTVEVFEREIRDLVRWGWLPPGEMRNRRAIAKAVERILGAAFEIGRSE